MIRTSNKCKLIGMKKYKKAISHPEGLLHL